MGAYTPNGGRRSIGGFDGLDALTIENTLSNTSTSKSTGGRPSYGADDGEEGMVGEVIRVYDPTAPGQLSANYEIKVQFTEPKPWIAHFAPDELSAA